MAFYRIYRIKGWNVELLFGLGYFTSVRNAFLFSYVKGQTGVEYVRLPFVLVWRG